MRGGHAQRYWQSTVESHLQTLTAELVPIERSLWALAVATAALDVLLTYWGLEAGLTEGNPLVASLLESLGITALVALKAGVFALAGLARWVRPTWGPWLPLGLAVPWLLAAGVNAGLILSV